MKTKVESFYDDFTALQLEAGISKRNISIQSWCEKFGLKNYHNVLEVGCGIGTQTELLSNYINSGKITAVDISTKSIEIAKNRLKDRTNIEFIVGDIVLIDYKPKEKFDMIILPDVIEHVPLQVHNAMFKRFREMLKDSGSIIIHIPNPNYLEWCHTNCKEKLQVIDQPIYTDLICANAYPNDFYIFYLETYEIWTVNCDYQIIVLKPKSSANSFWYKQSSPTFKQKLSYKLKSIFGLHSK